MSNHTGQSVGEDVVPLHPATVISAGSVVIHAASVTVAKDEEEKPDGKLGWRYGRNAVFLIVLTLLTTLWFQQHLQTWVTQRLIFGTVTAWAMWQLAFSLAKNDFAKDGERIRKRLLGGEGTGTLLIFACLAAAVLLALTASVYVTLDDRDTTHLRVDVVDPATGKPVMDSVVVESSSRVAGRMLFPRLEASKVNIVVVDPIGYEYRKNPVELKPWTSLDLKFGDTTQFTKKKLHAVRVVTGWTINGFDAPGNDPYDLTVIVSGRRYTLPGVRFGTIYTGVSQDKWLKAIIKENTNAAFGTELQAHLYSYSDRDKNDDYTYLNDWQKRPQTLTTPEFQEGQSVVAEIGPHGKPAKVRSKPVTISPDDDVTTIFLESQS